MKIVSLNVNDFGGTTEHLEEYKRIYGYHAIRKWDNLDKEQNILGILEFIEKYNPEVIVLQEFDINSKEAKNFIAKLKNLEYELKSEFPSRRPSMTVMFIKSNINYKEIKTCHIERSLRAYAIRIEDYIIYGTHVPPKYDEIFWNEIDKFWANYKKYKSVMIGDFNTINFRNEERMNDLLEEAIDVWNVKGNEDKISIAGDYAIISRNIDIKTVEIKKENSVLIYTDHPAIILILN